MTAKQPRTPVAYCAGTSSDNVPFEKSFEGCIEKYYKNDRGTLYACLPIFYLAPGGIDPYEPIPAADRYGYWVKGPLEAAGFKVIGQPHGDVETQDMAGFGPGKWRNDCQLWWTGGRSGGQVGTLGLGQERRAGTRCEPS